MKTSFPIDGVLLYCVSIVVIAFSCFDECKCLSPFLLYSIVRLKEDGHILLIIAFTVIVIKINEEQLPQA